MIRFQLSFWTLGRSHRPRKWHSVSLGGHRLTIVLIFAQKTLWLLLSHHICAPTSCRANSPNCCGKRQPHCGVESNWKELSVAKRWRETDRQSDRQTDILHHLNMSPALLKQQRQNRITLKSYSETLHFCPAQRAPALLLLQRIILLLPLWLYLVTSFNTLSQVHSRDKNSGSWIKLLPDSQVQFSVSEKAKRPSKSWPLPDKFSVTRIFFSE